MRRSLSFSLRACWICALTAFVGFVLFYAMSIFPSVAYGAESYIIPQLNVELPGLNLKNYPVIQNGDVAGFPFLAAYMGVAYQFLLGISLIVTAIMFVYGGILYIWGSTLGEIESGKKKITDAVIGLVLVFGAYVLFSTVSPASLSFRPIALKTVERKTMEAQFASDKSPTEALEGGETGGAGSFNPPPKMEEEIYKSGTGSYGGGSNSPSGQSFNPAGQALSGSGNGPIFGTQIGSPIPGKPIQAPYQPTGKLNYKDSPVMSPEEQGSGGSFGEEYVIRGGNKGCTAAPAYPRPESPCQSRDDCFKLFCDEDSKSLTMKGLPDQSTFKKFTYFPRNAEEQFEQYGVTFIDGLYDLVKNKRKKQIKEVKVYFPLKPNVTNVPFEEANSLLPEAHDALLKAGQIAKARGYFLAVFSMSRSMQTQTSDFCQRMRDSKEAATKGLKKQMSTGGLGLPGKSNHQYGIAVDIVLLRMNPGGYPELLTPTTPLCEGSVNQVDQAAFMGIEYTKTLQEIMSEAGWKRWCPELWHFDYKGIYKDDCFECAFPPEPVHKDMANCKVNYKPPA